MNFSIPDCNSKSVTLKGLGDGGRDSNNPFHSEITERGVLALVGMELTSASPYGTVRWTCG